MTYDLMEKHNTSNFSLIAIGNKNPMNLHLINLNICCSTYSNPVCIYLKSNVCLQIVTMAAGFINRITQQSVSPYIPCCVLLHMSAPSVTCLYLLLQLGENLTFLSSICTPICNASDARSEPDQPATKAVLPAGITSCVFIRATVKSS